MRGCVACGGRQTITEHVRNDDEILTGVQCLSGRDGVTIGVVNTRIALGRRPGSIFPRSIRHVSHKIDEHLEVPDWIEAGTAQVRRDLCVYADSDLDGSCIA